MLIRYVSCSKAKKNTTNYIFIQYKRSLIYKKVLNSHFNQLKSSLKNLKLQILNFAFKKQEKKSIKNVSCKQKIKSKGYQRKKYTFFRFCDFTCLVGEFCHFFTTRMLECLNCIPIIAYYGNIPPIFLSTKLLNI